MRNLAIACTAAVLLAGPAVAQQAPRSDVLTLNRARCAPAAGVVDYRKRKPPSLKLGDQPPASQFYTVYNVVDGCPQPIVLRKGIGNNPQNTVPVLRIPPRPTRAN